MKLNGFLVGGLIGAAATVYISRRKPGAMSWAANAMSNAYSAVARKSVSGMMGKPSMDGAANLDPKHSENTAVRSEAAWEQIKAIVNSDPAIRHEADKIKAEASAHTH